MLCAKEGRAQAAPRDRSERTEDSQCTAAVTEPALTGNGDSHPYRDENVALQDWPTTGGGNASRLDGGLPSLEIGADGSIALAPSEVLREGEFLTGNAVQAVQEYLLLKRCLDILGGMAALAILALPLLVVAALVRFTSRGPALYVHKRVGKGGREFVCYKFRTMIEGAEHQKQQLAHRNAHDDSRTFKIPDDPRVTWIGYWLRRTSIDELPQFYNVLRGELSLVGPRPALPSEVAMYSSRDRMRLLVTPGLTCIWQVSGRSQLAFPEQVEMDIEYIQRRCLAFDLKLIAKTIPAVLSSDGAY